MFYIIFFVTLAIDIVTKMLAKGLGFSRIDLVGNIMYLKYIHNPGIAFGIPVWGILLKIITLVFIWFIAYYYFSEEKKRKIPRIDAIFGLILAGAVGNAIERILNGSVIDFIGIQHFAIFNMADVAICSGAILYILHLMKNKK